MKILHISDTHSYHKLLAIPDDIEMIIHSGDFSDYKDYYKNEPEAKDFLNWYGNLNIKYKILIAGNHDAMPAINPTEFKSLCDYYNIIYLENDFVEIEGLKIWGSPLTPSFGNWYFMKNRGKLFDIWKEIPDDTDIVVVHGPPKGILDYSYNRDGTLERCGCSALRNRMINLKPKLVCFGHIHSCEDIINAGTLKLSIGDTIYSNGSVVTDGRFGKLSSNGNIFDL